ncbi:MAG: hypothetical protein AAF493_16510, partial [Pseudomonadota bacterium]
APSSQIALSDQRMEYSCSLLRRHRQLFYPTLRLPPALECNECGALYRETERGIEELPMATEKRA